jgi:hypothetical protein
MNDTSIMLPPSLERTIYVQVRNTSENQQASPTDIPARLVAKGYTIATDPNQAAYWLQSQVIYCHKAADQVTPEMIAKSGFGSGLGSGGVPLAAAGNTGHRPVHGRDGRRHAGRERHDAHGHGW